jgi:hypothetical protein
MNESDKKLITEKLLGETREERIKRMSRERAKKWRLLNKERHVEYTKQWKQDHPDRVTEYNKRHRNVIHQRAQHSLQKALKSGKVVRPDTCELCGGICKAEGHHPDYSKRLDVMWLCRACHVYVHEGRKVANG